MKLSLFTLPLMLLLAGSAQAAPVLYSFDAFDPATGLRDFSFQLTTPAYLVNGQSYTFTAGQLVNAYVAPPFQATLSVVVLRQEISQGATPYPVNFLSMLLERDPDSDLNPMMQLSKGPGQPGVYLDRDGDYFLSQGQVFSSSVFNLDNLTLSVTATPEPGTLGLAGFAMLGTVAYGYRRRDRENLVSAVGIEPTT